MKLVTATPVVAAPRAAVEPSVSGSVIWGTHSDPRDLVRSAGYIGVGTPQASAIAAIPTKGIQYGAPFAHPRVAKESLALQQAIDGVDMSGGPNPQLPAGTPFIAITRVLADGSTEVKVWERSHMTPRDVLDAAAAAHTLFSRLAAPAAQTA